MTQQSLFSVSSVVDANENAYYAFPTGTVYVRWEGKDDTGTTQTWLDIHYFGSSFTASDFNNAPLGSELTSHVSGAVMKYVKTAASTWTEVGDLT